MKGKCDQVPLASEFCPKMSAKVCHAQRKQATGESSVYFMCLRKPFVLVKGPEEPPGGRLVSWTCWGIVGRQSERIGEGSE